MLVEAWREAREPDASGRPASPAAPPQLGLALLVGLSIATSIDAFAVGVTLPMLHAPLAVSIVTIGATTAVLSAGGFAAGRRFGAALGRRVDVAGGVALILLGTKILVEHLTA
jgi:putative Mn2+ efflux pump MntP